ncbi:hypothetical protein MMC26_004643 [Xylographa opegraphella]|nr:hypothetical protein [Xylographa opegraphella]
MAHDGDQAMQSFVPSNSTRQNLLSGLGGSARKRAHADIHNPDDVEHDKGQALIKTEPEIEEEERSGKRSRTTEWPLQDSTVVEATDWKDQKHSRKSQSPQRRRQVSRFHWSSRFKEGSMHDRPSNQPPIEYLGQDQFIQEQLMEQYTAERGGMNVRTSEDLNALYHAGNQSARPSSMYRFGKALVNAFNPIMVWHGLNGKWKEKMEEETNPEKRVLEQRREKAETAYAELKRAGYPSTQSMSTVDISSARLDHDRTFISSRDSGIDVDGYCSSSERKRDGHVFDADNIVTGRKSSSGIGDSVSPGPDIHTGPKSTLHLRKGSFTSLKKVKSHLQLPTPQRRPISPAPSPSIEVDQMQRSAEKRTIRKQLSKKDLQKQQKLTKKVSDLESKLEKARRELYQSMDDVPPVPPLPSTGTLRPFVPGALASLPSERLLSGHLVGSTASLADPATSTMERGTGTSEVNVDLTDSRRHQAETPTTKKAHRPTGSNLRAVSTDKRKSGNPGEVWRKSAPNDEDPIGSPTETKEVLRMEPGTSTRSTKVDWQESQKLSKGAHDDTVLHEITNNSTANHGTTKEVSPSGRCGFDPVNVDETKALALEASSNSDDPFGNFADDICNPRKVFPNITNHQIIKYFPVMVEGGRQHPLRTSSKHLLPTGGTGLLNTSVVSIESPDTLDRIPTVSPPKATPWSQRSLSPPPSHDITRHIETSLRNSWGAAVNDVVRISPKKNNNVPPVPKVPKALGDQKAKVLEEVTEKEEWQWDDDVF